jgi:nucleotide-binding universal stress UspA family protein
MKAFKHILVPTDFSPAADDALDLALSLATPFASKVTLLHAYENPVATYGYAEMMSWPIADMADAAQKELDKALAKVKERYPTATAILAHGAPWEKILETAKNLDCDLVVMGTHGRRGLARVAFGSVAEKIVRLSPVPVLTVSRAADRPAKEKAAQAAIAK